MKKQLYEAGGWFGVALILFGYFLLATGIIDGQATLYHLLMLVGSALVGVISYIRRAFQPAVLNILFFVFALTALVRIAL